MAIRPLDLPQAREAVKKRTSGGAGTVMIQAAGESVSVPFVSVLFRRLRSRGGRPGLGPPRGLRGRGRRTRRLAAGGLDPTPGAIAPDPREETPPHLVGARGGAPGVQLGGVAPRGGA